MWFRLTIFGGDTASMAIALLFLITQIGQCHSAEAIFRPLVSHSRVTRNATILISKSTNPEFDEYMHIPQESTTEDGLFSFFGGISRNPPDIVPKPSAYFKNSLGSGFKLLPYDLLKGIKGKKDPLIDSERDREDLFSSASWPTQSPLQWEYPVGYLGSPHQLGIKNVLLPSASYDTNAHNGIHLTDNDEHSDLLAMPSSPNQQYTWAIQQSNSPSTFDYGKGQQPQSLPQGDNSFASTEPIYLVTSSDQGVIGDQLNLPTNTLASAFSNYQLQHQVNNHLSDQPQHHGSVNSGNYHSDITNLPLANHNQQHQQDSIDLNHGHPQIPEIVQNEQEVLSGHSRLPSISIQESHQPILPFHFSSTSSAAAVYQNGNGGSHSRQQTQTVVQNSQSHVLFDNQLQQLIFSTLKILTDPKYEEAGYPNLEFQPPDQAKLPASTDDSGHGHHQYESNQIHSAGVQQHPTHTHQQQYQPDYVAPPAQSHLGTTNNHQQQQIPNTQLSHNNFQHQQHTHQNPIQNQQSLQHPVLSHHQNQKHMVPNPVHAQHRPQKPVLYNQHLQHVPQNQVHAKQQEHSPQNPVHQQHQPSSPQDPVYQHHQQHSPQNSVLPQERQHLSQNPIHSQHQQHLPQNPVHSQQQHSPQNPVHSQHQQHSPQNPVLPQHQQHSQQNPVLPQHRQHLPQNPGHSQQQHSPQNPVHSQHQQHSHQNPVLPQHQQHLPQNPGHSQQQRSPQNPGHTHAQQHTTQIPVHALQEQYHLQPPNNNLPGSHDDFLTNSFMDVIEQHISQINNAMSSSPAPGSPANPNHQHTSKSPNQISQIPEQHQHSIPNGGSNQQHFTANHQQVYPVAPAPQFLPPRQQPTPAHQQNSHSVVPQQHQTVSNVQQHFQDNQPPQAVHPSQQHVPVAQAPHQTSPPTPAHQQHLQTHQQRSAQHFSNQQYQSQQQHSPQQQWQGFSPAPQQPSQQRQPTHQFSTNRPQHSSQQQHHTQIVPPSTQHQFHNVAPTQQQQHSPNQQHSRQPKTQLQLQQLAAAPAPTTQRQQYTSQSQIQFSPQFGLVTKQQKQIVASASNPQVSTSANQLKANSNNSGHQYTIQMSSDLSTKDFEHPPTIAKDILTFLANNGA